MPSNPPGRYKGGKTLRKRVGLRMSQAEEKLFEGFAKEKGLTGPQALEALAALAAERARAQQRPEPLVKPAKARVDGRISPELHEALNTEAERRQTTINALLTEVLLAFNPTK